MPFTLALSADRLRPGREAALRVRLALPKGSKGISEAPGGCSDLLHGSWRPPRPKLTQHGAGDRASTSALRETAAEKVGNRGELQWARNDWLAEPRVRWKCLPFAAPERGRRRDHRALTTEKARTTRGVALLRIRSVFGERVRRHHAFRPDRHGLLGRGAGQ